MKTFVSAYYLITSLLLLVIISSCKKDTFITSPDAKISTSIDSLKYDTVFTSIGSVTQSFKINNNNDQKLLLTNVKVMGGTASAFKININGNAAQELSNIELAANDSMYVFVSVHINPNLQNLPFIVKDSIQISFNGNTRFVQLEAYGQNANFLRNKLIDVNTTWNNRLPYVILDRLQIDTNITLTLDPGCKVYCHADAPILVDGTLIVNGTKDLPVIFRGDRVDEEYKDLPASWPGIYFRETSKSSELTFTEVRNAYQAIVAENPASNLFPKVTLHQCTIDNAYDAGLLCVNSSLYADNSLISNCGNNINIILGGNYNLTNCTVAAYSTFISHKNPVLSANNFAMFDGAAVTTPLEANFENCIFWGDEGLLENEVQIARQGTDPFNVTFNKCLYRAATDPSAATITDCIRNQNPMFDSVNVSKRIFDFHISNDAAPGINYGTGTVFPADLDGNNRNNGLPDLGCYEKQ